MKILVITVAGMSSRFSESLGYPCLKCIYNEKGIEESMLYRMLYQGVEFDKYIIVGGFMYEELRTVIYTYFEEILPKVLLVKNERFAEYGSGYSLYLGLQYAVEIGFDELIFAEGDLFVDNKGFQQVYYADKDIITCNKEAICANKAVAFYYDLENKIHYIYDIGHSALEIDEPFLGIFNSGQIWKFLDSQKLKDIILNLQESELRGTNLVIIQKYFSTLVKGDYEVVELTPWINCNTVADFRKGMDMLK